MTPADMVARARAMIDQGQEVGAINLLGLACVHGEFDPEAHALLGRAYLAVGQPGLAQRPLEKALRLNPRHPTARKDLLQARRATGGSVAAAPWDRDHRRATALVVLASVMLGPAPWAVVGLTLHLPPLLIAAFLGIVGLVAWIGWVLLVQFAQVAKPNGAVLVHGRRSVLSYWRHARVPLALLAVILVLALVRPPHGLLAILALVLVLKSYLAVAVLLLAPGARPFYMIVDHMTPEQRCLVIKRVHRLHQKEIQLLAIRVEEVCIERSLMDGLLGLWALRVELARNAIPGVSHIYLETPDRVENAGRWRNEISRLISEGRRFNSNGR
ncbi:tetratricopeptide repeat protein [Caulobacter endophyticus]|uniref:tetratricopeptide repeat protein n=1 Tax=Caulobacter endophyticus TaxID=2172652 RepID=UPI00240F29CB|nr:tetratricopeptide repeat protein [Caulobacter endophyticus]MDG2528913.1 hypothetical protein [Caulobacter endophyticus]